MNILKADTIDYPKLYFKGLSSRISDDELISKIKCFYDIQQIYIYHGSHELQGSLKLKDSINLEDACDKLNSVRINGYRLKTRIAQENETFRGEKIKRSRSRSQQKTVVKETIPSAPGNTLLNFAKKIEENKEIVESVGDQFIEKYPFGKILYVGGVPEDSTPDEIVDFFNKVLNLAKLTIRPGNPCLACNVSGKAAFISCRSEQEVNNALNLDQIPYRGLKLKVGRSAQYKGPTLIHSTFPEKYASIYIPEMSSDFNNDYKKLLAALPSVPSEIVTAYSNIIEILPTSYLEVKNLLTVDDILDEEDYQYTYNDLRNKFQEWGTLITFTIIRSGDNRGFIYIQYETSEQSEKAIKELKNLLFDGKYVNANYISENEFKTRCIDVNNIQNSDVNMTE